MAVSSSKRPGKPALPDDRIEVLDGGNKPLLIMPQLQALRQHLRHRSVIVCLRSLAGDIFLHKRTTPEKHGELWNLAASGTVLAGESRYAAAARHLEAEQGLTGIALAEAASLPPSPATHNAGPTLFLTAGTSAVPRAAGGIFVNREELEALLRDAPHTATSLLHLAAPYIYP